MNEYRSVGEFCWSLQRAVSILLLAGFKTFPFSVFPYFHRMFWSEPERVRMVELYHQTGSATAARRRFMREGNRRRGPTVETIMRLVRSFRTSGSVSRGAGTRGPSAVTRRAAGLIRRAIARNPKLPVRKLARRTAVPRSIVQVILRKWMRLYPFKLQRVQRQQRGDKTKRMRLCHRLAPKLRTLVFPSLCT